MRRHIAPIRYIVFSHKKSKPPPSPPPARRGAPHFSLRTYCFFSARARNTVVGGRRVELVGDIVRIGRAQENDVVIDDGRVSRRHLELRWRTDIERYVVVDIGSSGGTWLNARIAIALPLMAMMLRAVISERSPVTRLHPP